MKISMLALLFCVSTSAFADTYSFSKSNNKVEWTAIGSPGFLRINGTGGAAEGSLETKDGKVSGTLTCALDTYKTGVELRDKHLQEKYLETAKYPTAKLVLKDQPYTDGKESTATADLTVKDVTKPVKITFTVSGKKVNAKFKLAIKDYPSIGVPSYLGVTVADEVEVSVDASL